MKKIKIGVVSSSRSLVDTARKVAEEKGIDFEGAYVGFDEAIPFAQRMEINGAEALLARAATPPIIREKVHVPVLSFPRTAIDIIPSIKEAKKYGDNILLISFTEMISGLTIIEDLLKCKITQIICNNREDVENVTSTCCKKFDAVIGGASTTSIALKYGMNVVETMTPEEVIISTIDNAISVIKSNREEQKKTLNFRCIIDSVSEGVISFDRNGNITNINNTAKLFLNINDSKKIDEYVNNIFSRPSLYKAIRSQKPILDQIENLNDEKYVFNHIPIVLNGEKTGNVTTFKPISNVIKIESEVRKFLSRGFVAKYTFRDLIHKSNIMEIIISRAKKFALTHSTILITGETGTGKEIIAQSVHEHSPRSKNPFVSINCAALSEHLLESELFGYEEGAFTGSRKGGKAGLFEIAHKGTIFLDEITSTTQRVQRLLLRVLQEKEVMRIGGDRIIPIDVRVIAASNNDIDEEVLGGVFRKDLFFRLNILRIQIPPLRERSEDIPLLMEYFIKNHYNGKVKMLPFTIPNKYLVILKKYFWPGNVRQLENFAERLHLLCSNKFDTEIFNEIFFELIHLVPDSTQKKGDEIYSLAKEHSILKKTNESEMIRRAIESSNYNKSMAAKKLGISRTTLWKKMKSTDIIS